MNRLISTTTLIALAACSAGLVLADDSFDPEARTPAWRQPAPLRWGGEREAYGLGGDESDPADDPPPSRLRLYDERGLRTGRVERHPLFRDRLDLYDESGARTGRIEQHPLFEDELEAYDRQGRRVQKIRKHPLFEDRYDIYDSRGRRVGSVRENPLSEGRYDIYDAQGRRTGRAEEDDGAGR